MTAVLSREQRSVVSDAQSLQLHETVDPFSVYNQIAVSGLIYFDTLRSMRPELLNGPHTLAHFPYASGRSSETASLNAAVNHARESFIIGLALRTDRLGELDELVDGMSELTPREPARELLQFGARAILERAYFESDATVIDGDPARQTSTARAFTGSGLLSGVSYEILPVAQ